MKGDPARGVHYLSLAATSLPGKGEKLVTPSASEEPATKRPAQAVLCCWRSALLSRRERRADAAQPPRVTTPRRDQAGIRFHAREGWKLLRRLTPLGTGQPPGARMVHWRQISSYNDAQQ